LKVGKNIVIQNTPFVYTNRKMTSVEFMGEKNDCTVNTLSILFNLPYRKAHRIMKENGRKDREPVIFDFVMLKLSVYQRSFSDYFMTLGEFCNSHRRGDWAVATNGHVFAYKEGVIYDNQVISPNTLLYKVWCTRLDNLSAECYT